MNINKATFGSGCFWCVEAIYKQFKGVKSVFPGYSGGSLANPTYKEVCSETTGHAEVVQIEYDADEIDFKDLLEVFFKTHDPTSLNRQGADVGARYRSVIFYHDENQEEIAEKVIHELELIKAYDQPIVTEVTSFTAFFEAEEYHKDYYEKNPEQGYCQAVVRPKVEKFKKVFQEKLK
jgi:peptide-methionine (S)-S-oxide reductase